MAKRVEKMRQRIADELEFPKDIVMDVPKVTMIGNVQLNIENHCGIIEYTSTAIRINTSIGVYKITGLDLIIKNIITEEITVTGSIENIDILD